MNYILSLLEVVVLLYYAIETKSKRERSYIFLIKPTGKYNISVEKLRLYF